MPTISGDLTTESRRRVCAVTGLALKAPDLDLAYRIAKESFGALSPPLRTPGRVPAGQWGRYDVTGEKTLYAADCAEAAYAESLAHFRPALSDVDVPDLADLFDAEGDEDDGLSLAAMVNSEWEAAHHMPIGQIAAGWRQERRMNRILLPFGWFIDIETSESISVLRDHCGDILHAAGVDYLDTSHLRGANRSLTTALAQRLHSLVLDDGFPALGVAYGSRHDSRWTNWALWMREALDDAAVPELASTEMISEPQQNPPLDQVCKLFGLRCH